MQLRKTCKSVGAVMLTLALLVGMLSVMGTFPATAAVLESWKFTGDWTESGVGASGAFNEANTSAVDAAFNVYAGCETRFAQMGTSVFGTNYADISGASDDSTVQLKTAETGITMYNYKNYYTDLTMRNFISLVPKNAKGQEVVVRNFETEFDLNTQLMWGQGGFMLMFGAQESGRVALGQTTPYAERAAVMISADGIKIVDGKLASLEDADLAQKPFKENIYANVDGGYEKFPSGYTTGNNNGSKSMHVYVKVLNGNVTVKLTTENAEFYNKTTAISWDRYGYIAYAGMMGSNTVSNMTLKALDGNGKQVTLEGKKADDFTFTMDNSAYISSGAYDFSAHGDATAIRNEIDEKFNVYSGRETNNGHVKKDLIGTDTDFDCTSGVNRLMLTPNGLQIYAKTGGYSTNTNMRNWMSLVPKINGKEVSTKNFEISFDTTIRQRYGHGALMLQFRSQPASGGKANYSDVTTVVSGKLANSEPTAYTERAAVLLGANGVGVLSGNKVHDGSESAALLASSFYSDSEKTNSGVVYQMFENTIKNSNPMSRTFKVYVRVVGANVTVKIYEPSTGLELYSGTSVIDYDKEGVIAISGMQSEHDISNITLNLLDENGDAADVAVEEESLDWTFSMNNSAYVTSGTYDFSSHANADAIRNAIDAKFNVYSGREGYSGKVDKAYLGTDTDFNDTWGSGGENQVKLTADGLNIYSKFSGYSKNNSMRNWMSLVPKDAQGNEIVAKNFEISFDTTIRQRWGHGGLMVQFRSQPTAAKVPETVSYSDSTTVSGKVANGENSAYTERAAVLLGANGVGVLSGNKVHDGSENAGLLKHCLYTDKAAELENVLYEFYSSKISNTDSMTRSLKVNIKVVNSTVTVKVAEAGGAELYNKDITIDYDKEGVIAISGLSSDLDISNITLKTLNSYGEQVAVDTPVYETFGYEQNYAELIAAGNDFSLNNDTNNAIRDAVDAKFNVYHQYGTTKKLLEKAEIFTEQDDNWDSSKIQLSIAGANGQYLQTCATNSAYSPNGGYPKTMRNTLSLVPKNADGEEIVAKNFEVSFKLKTKLTWSTGGFMLMFRAQDSGNVSVNDNIPYAQRAAVVITANGAGIVDGADESVVNEGLWQAPAKVDNGVIKQFESGAKTNGSSDELDVYIKALNEKVTVKISNAATGAVMYTEEKNIEWQKAGVISFSGLMWEQQFGDISLNVLNDEGVALEPVVKEFEEGKVALEPKYDLGSKDGSKIYATVTPDDDVQLKAGSLRARRVGSTGDYNILPTRVGWRTTNYQADTFVFDVDFDIEVTAEFYTPHTTAAANVAVLGTSKTPSGDKDNLYGNAVRFISRSYIYAKDGAFYMDINGQAMEVEDFGAYVTSQMALTKGGYEDIKDAIKDAIKGVNVRNLVKRSIPKAGEEQGKIGIFYDFSSKYVDTSIQITGISAGYLDQEIVSCTYIQFANGDVVYTNVVTTSYNNAG